jgi:hypothetical protein
MMTLLPSSVPASHTKGRVGMLGGFFANALCYLVAGSQQTHLHEDKLRRMGYSPEESMQDGYHLLRNFYRRKDDKW